MTLLTFLFAALLNIPASEPHPTAPPLTAQESHSAPATKPETAHATEPENHHAKSAEAAVHPAPEAAEKAAGNQEHSPKKPPAIAVKVTPRSKGVLCGPLPKSLSWKARQGPLRLTGTVTLGPGISLSLGAGTEVQVAASDSCPDSGSAAGGPTVALVVRGGNLKIAGTPDKPVRFVPAGRRGFSWDGIRIEQSTQDSQANLRWFEVSGATKGVSFLAGAGRIEHAVIAECGIGIASMRGASPSIRHCVISHSSIADIVSSRSATRILGCLFWEGRGDGIRFDGIGLSDVRHSCFWGHRGTEVVRGPVGAGAWKGDSVPDSFGNWRRDPVLRQSAEHERRLASTRKTLAEKPWWNSRRLPADPPGSGPWALSPFSPLIDKGETRFCSDPDGSKCDIGLWGGN